MGQRSPYFVLLIFPSLTAQKTCKLSAAVALLIAPPRPINTPFPQSLNHTFLDRLIKNATNLRAHLLVKPGVCLDHTSTHIHGILPCKTCTAHHVVLHWTPDRNTDQRWPNVFHVTDDLFISPSSPIRFPPNHSIPLRCNSKQNANVTKIYRSRH